VDHLVVGRGSSAFVAVLGNHKEVEVAAYYARVHDGAVLRIGHPISVTREELLADLAINHYVGYGGKIFLVDRI